MAFGIGSPSAGGRVIFSTIHLPPSLRSSKRMRSRPDSRSSSSIAQRARRFNSNSPISNMPPGSRTRKESSLARAVSWARFCESRARFPISWETAFISPFSSAWAIRASSSAGSTEVRPFPRSFRISSGDSGGMASSSVLIGFGVTTDSTTGFSSGFSGTVCFALGRMNRSASAVTARIAARPRKKYEMVFERIWWKI